MSFDNKYSIISTNGDIENQEVEIKVPSFQQALNEAKKLAIDTALEHIKENEKDQQFSLCFDNIDYDKFKIIPSIPYEELIYKHESKFKYGAIVMESSHKEKIKQAYEVLKIETVSERSWKTAYIIPHTVKRVKLIKMIIIKENLATSEQFLEELNTVVGRIAKKLEESSTTGFDDKGNPIIIHSN